MKKRSSAVKSALFILSFSIVTLMGGCAPQTRDTVSIEPDTEGFSGADIDFIQVHDDVIDAFGNEETNPYVYITDLVINGTNDPKALFITASCIEGTTEEDSERFAAACLRRVAAAIAIQSAEFEGGTQTDFGNVYDTFSVSLTISLDGAEEGDYLYDLELEPGDEIPLDPDIETYEESWAETRGMILENSIY